MKWHVRWLAVILITASGFGQAPVQPVIVSKPEVEGAVTRVVVRPHFVTAIRMPEAVNSVAVGDPKLFQVEHSPSEPTVVFVKVLTTQPAESNLLISTGEGHETSLLVVSHGSSSKSVDFVVEYKRAGSFMIAPDYPSDLIGETVPMAQAQQAVAFGRKEKPVVAMRSASLMTSAHAPRGPVPDRGRPGALDALLARQEHAPLPKLYGERPGVENPHGD